MKDQLVIGFGFGLAIMFFVYLKEERQGRWIGTVYPDRNNLYRHKFIGEFNNLDSCLKAVNKQAGIKGSYECAKNCNKSSMPMVCEETVGNEK